MTQRQSHKAAVGAVGRRNLIKIISLAAIATTLQFDTSYPGSRAPQHIHFEVSAKGFATRIFEIVSRDDPFVTSETRSNPAFSVRPVEAGGRVTERIVLK